MNLPLDKPTSIILKVVDSVNCTSQESLRSNHNTCQWLTGVMIHPVKVFDSNLYKFISISTERVYITPRIFSTKQYKMKANT